MIVRTSKNWRFFFVFSFSIGLGLSSVVLHFLFGSSMYDRYGGLLAPSSNFLGIGVVGAVERSVSYAVDATIFGAIILVSIEVLRLCLAFLRRVK